MLTRFFHIISRSLPLCLLLITAAAGKAQVTVNNTIDPSDTQLVNAVHFMERYLAEFTPAKQYLPDFSKYWPDDDCQRYRIPDKLIYAINTKIPTYMLGRPRILYARPEGGMVHIKTMFSKVDSNGNVLVTSITNHYISKTSNGRLHFVSPMALQESSWRTTEFKSVEYHYPAYHKFDKGKAGELAAKIEALEEQWQLQPIYIRYYFAETKEEIEHYRGFDFTIAMGNADKPGGISDGIDNMIWCGGLGENYFHEVVHLYLNKLFPKSPLIEGLAVFYGGSLGQDLKWHLERLNDHLLAHPGLDLNDIDDFYYLDNYTNPLSTIQGLLCLMAYNKEGLNGLKRTMNYTSVAALLQQEYGVEQNGWNAFFRKAIAEQAK